MLITMGSRHDMAKSLKTLGLAEAKALRARVRRQYSLGRIGDGEYSELEHLMYQFIQLVETMEEKDDRESPQDPQDR